MQIEFVITEEKAKDIDLSWWGENSYFIKIICEGELPQMVKKVNRYRPVANPTLKIAEGWATLMGDYAKAEVKASYKITYSIEE